jgi:trans-2,3-dihydro-3-hydroxyanthranilate isomerase
MPLQFHTLDVFTDRRFGGNPLAVVHEADGLTAAQMQQIARELNLSETVFVLKPDNPAHSAKIRIFTPERELPFAGHPTIGTAILLAEQRVPLMNGEQDAIIVLEQPIGTVRVGVRMRAGAAPFAEFDAPKLPEIAGTLPSRDRIADALGLIPREIGFENHSAMQFTAGNTFAFVPISSLEAWRPSGKRVSTACTGRRSSLMARWTASTSIRDGACERAPPFTRVCSPRNLACPKTLPRVPPQSALLAL